MAVSVAGKTSGTLQALRCIYCWFVHSETPFHARWGTPESHLTLLFGSAHSNSLDTRTSPKVFTLDGYGEVGGTRPHRSVHEGDR